jgi:hypothetical protein
MSLTLNQINMRNFIFREHFRSEETLSRDGLVPRLQSFHSYFILVKIKYAIREEVSIGGLHHTWFALVPRSDRGAA